MTTFFFLVVLGFFTSTTLKFPMYVCMYVQCSRILLTRSGETVHENLSKHRLFAVLNVPFFRRNCFFQTLFFTFMFAVFFIQLQQSVDNTYGRFKTTIQ